MDENIKNNVILNGGSTSDESRTTSMSNTGCATHSKNHFNIINNINAKCIKKMGFTPITNIKRRKTIK